MALNRLSPNNEPLTGESGFFEQHFFVGFWHDIPPVVPPPPGQQEAPRAPPVLQDLSRYKAPEACRYGQACRFKLSCSRFHGEQSVHGRNCTCEEEDCLKGHPLRAGRDRQRPQASLPGASLTPLTGCGTATAGGLSTTAPWPAQQHWSPFRRQPPPGYTCAKCGETDHYLNECSKNTCFKCGVKGHIATNCPGRPEGVGRGGMGGLAGAGSLVPPQGVPPPPPEHPPRYLGFDDSGSFREASADWTGHKRQLNGM